MSHNRHSSQKSSVVQLMLGAFQVAFLFTHPAYLDADNEWPLAHVKATWRVRGAAGIPGGVACVQEQRDTAEDAASTADYSSTAEYSRGCSQQHNLNRSKTLGTFFISGIAAMHARMDD